MSHKVVLLVSILSISYFLPLGVNGQWVRTKLPYSGSVRCLVVNGSNLFAGTADGGVFISTDEGTNWVAPNNGLTNDTINALCASGTNLFAGTQDGVFLSTDNGISWNTTNNGLTNTTVNCLLMKDSNIFAGTQGGGIFLSSNTGANWHLVASGFVDDSIYAIAVRDGKFYAATTGVIYISADNGKSWSIELDARARTFSVSGSNLYVLDDVYDIFLSPSEGANWTLVENPISGPIGSTAILALDSNLFIGDYLSGVYLTTDNGITLKAVNSGMTPASVTTFAYGPSSSSSPQLFVGTDTNGVIWKRPISELTSQALPAIDTQVIMLDSSSTMTATLNGDSSGYSLHRIDFENNSGVSLVIADVFLTNSNQFAIAQFLPGLPDTLKPGDVFSMIVRFYGDSLGSIYQDTIVLTINHALTSLHLALIGRSFDSKSSVPQAKFVPSILQNYPNPFGTSTSVKVSVTQSDPTDISILNLLGQPVARLFSGELASGEHSFTWDANGMPAGMYMCVVRRNGGVQQVPMMIVR